MNNKKEKVNKPLAFVKVFPTPMTPREKMVPKKLAPKIVTKAKTSKNKGSTSKRHSPSIKKKEASTCYYCGKKGHFKSRCNESYNVYA